LNELRELIAYRDLVALWSVRNITLRYKRSVLGVFWTLLEPLLLMSTLAVVFSTVFRFTVVNYPIYVLTGLLVFDFLNRSTSQMVDEIITSQGMTQRIHLPRSAFAVATIASYLVNWGLALIPLFGIMLVLGHPFSWALIAIPPSMFFMALFALGVGLIVSTLGAFFHDVKFTYNVLLGIWFYATPIIYPIDIIPESYRRILQLNPVLHLLNLFRSSVYSGRAAPLSEWVIGASMSIATFALGWWLFTRWHRVFDRV
jgi:ABC-type polysaccharide/polyol phosphate export permease